ncbi:MAG: HAD family phosphatase [Pseudomonadota bacterium]
MLCRAHATPCAYLFDMDGLLLDTERAILEATLTLLVPRGHDPAEVRRHFLSLVGSSAAFTKDYITRWLGEDAAQFETDLKALHSRNMAQAVPVKPTVRATLAALAAGPAPMAVVTSTQGATARHHLQMAGLFDLFSVVVAGDEVTANKPDPAPYVQAARLLGVDPARCAAFEDSDRGITAAVRAGCLSVQIPDLRPPDTPLPDLGQWVAATLAEAVAPIQNRAILEGSP